MTTAATIDHTLERLRRQAGERSELVEALEFLADAGSTGDPFGALDAGVRDAVLAIDRRRHRAHRGDLALRSLTTAQVVELVASISDRRGVDRRRQRGRLLGVREGTVVRHPRWQFDVEVGESREGLVEVLAALADVAASPEAADALMTASRADLAGGSLAGLFTDGEVALVVRLIRMAGDQS